MEADDAATMTQAVQSQTAFTVILYLYLKSRRGRTHRNARVQRRSRWGSCLIMVQHSTYPVKLQTCMSPCQLHESFPSCVTNFQQRLVDCCYVEVESEGNSLVVCTANDIISTLKTVEDSDFEDVAFSRLPVIVVRKQNGKQRHQLLNAVNSNDCSNSLSRDLACISSELRVKGSAKGHAQGRYSTHVHLTTPWSATPFTPDLSESPIPLFRRSSHRSSNIRYTFSSTKMPGTIEDRQEQGGIGPGSHRTLPGAAAAALGPKGDGRRDEGSYTQNGVSASQAQHSVPEFDHGVGTGPQIRSTNNELEVQCGPLLNYRRMSGEHTASPVWHGSVLIVTTPGNDPDALRLSCVGSGGAQTNGHAANLDQSFQGSKLYEDPNKAFWQFSIELPFQEQESQWEYLIPRMKSTIDTRNLSSPKRFSVPSKHESMRIMFHSCNGFSVGTDVDAWSGPALWNDVLRVHDEKPFHVMIGGGDQIYNDSVRVDGPLREWTDIGNPRKRREYPFPEELRKKCDEFYFNNYSKWYSTEPFASANAQVPQLNIWDDHDIIDGFGSYTDHFMKCSVFRGIGGVAHKYYMLFQHHVPPPVSTYSTDAPQTTHAQTGGSKADATQLQDTYVMKLQHEDESYIFGRKQGPYVEERSRNIYSQLGKGIAFVGVDARTERTRHQINYPETYDLIFDHASKQIGASNGAIKHMVLLLGVPIAYPRLQWLENILQSPLIGPIRFLNKRFGLAGGFFNQFDGNVDLLDDLDDHYTAHQHKKERKDLILRLQHLAKQHDVRVSILGGDVHLAALGRFYSNPKLNIAAEADWRYMPNIISSAITNKPPPQAVANLLAKRNKIHHLDHDTDETLLELFDKDPGDGQPGVKPKSAATNHATMPSRNYAIITESHSHAALNNAANGAAPNGITNGTAEGSFTAPKNPREPLHTGEEGAGISHAAAAGLERTGLAGTHGLDVTIRVEINPADREGKTQGYGFSIPALRSATASSNNSR
nr:uncharacterized protein CFP56_62469 [Quercus suber]